MCVYYDPYIGLHVTKHAVSVVPDTEEPQHMSVHLQELLQTVVGGACGVRIGGHVTRLGVGISRKRLRRRQLNPLTDHEILSHVIRRGCYVIIM